MSAESAHAIAGTIERWREFVRGDLPGGLDELLADEVVFYSPVVFTPQRGRAITTRYLEAAIRSLAGERPGGEDRGDGSASGFRYTKQVIAGDTAVLEFETTVEGTYINGVDIIRCDDDGRIVEFRVMIRPLQAVNLVHAQMRAMLEALASDGG